MLRSTQQSASEIIHHTVLCEKKYPPLCEGVRTEPRSTVSQYSWNCTLPEGQRNTQRDWKMATLAEIVK